MEKTLGILRIYSFFLLNFTAVQNERDSISKKPKEEDKKYGITTQTILSAEVLSRPATSPPGWCHSLFL